MYQRGLVIFRLVWDFGGRLFDLFLEPLFGAKKLPFFNPKAVPNQRENYQRGLIPKAKTTPASLPYYEAKLRSWVIGSYEQKV